MENVSVFAALNKLYKEDREEFKCIFKAIGDGCPVAREGGPFNNHTIELNGKILAVGDRVLPGPENTVEIIIYFAIENDAFIDDPKEDMSEYMNKKYGDNWVFYKK